MKKFKFLTMFVCFAMTLTMLAGCGGTDENAWTLGKTGDMTTINHDTTPTKEGEFGIGSIDLDSNGILQSAYFEVFSQNYSKTDSFNVLDLKLINDGNTYNLKCTDRDYPMSNIVKLRLCNESAEDYSPSDVKIDYNKTISVDITYTTVDGDAASFKCDINVAK